MRSRGDMPWAISYYYWKEFSFLGDRSITNAWKEMVEKEKILLSKSHLSLLLSKHGDIQSSREISGESPKGLQGLRHRACSPAGELHNGIRGEPAAHHLDLLHQKYRSSQRRSIHHHNHEIRGMDRQTDRCRLKPFNDSYRLARQLTGDLRTLSLQAKVAGAKILLPLFLAIIGNLSSTWNSILSSLTAHCLQMVSRWVILQTCHTDSGWQWLRCRVHLLLQEKSQPKTWAALAISDLVATSESPILKWPRRQQGDSDVPEYPNGLLWNPLTSISRNSFCSKDNWKCPLSCSSTANWRPPIVLHNEATETHCPNFITKSFWKQKSQHR